MNPDVHSLAGPYALGALREDEERLFDAHLPRCETCQRDVADFRATATRLAEEVATEPPTELKARVMAEAVRTRQVAPVVVPMAGTRWDTRRMMAAALAVAAVLVLVIGGLVVSRDGGGGGFDAAIAEVVAAPDAKMLVLDGQPGSARGASLKMYVSEQKQRSVVVGERLDPLPKSKTYELWTIDESGAARAGVFKPDEDGTVRVVMQGAITAGVLGVTIEPAGGSEQPTTDVIYRTGTA